MASISKAGSNFIDLEPICEDRYCSEDDGDCSEDSSFLANLSPYFTPEPISPSSCVFENFLEAESFEFLALLGFLAYGVCECDSADETRGLEC